MSKSADLFDGGIVNEQVDARLIAGAVYSALLSSRKGFSESVEVQLRDLLSFVVTTAGLQGEVPQWDVVLVERAREKQQMLSVARELRETDRERESLLADLTALKARYGLTESRQFRLSETFDRLAGNATRPTEAS